MAPKDLYHELREVNNLDKKDGEKLLRRVESYLADNNYQWNRIRLIDTNLALKYLLLRCLSLELQLENRQLPDLEPCGE